MSAITASSVCPTQARLESVNELHQSLLGLYNKRQALIMIIISTSAVQTHVQLVAELVFQSPRMNLVYIKTYFYVSLYRCNEKLINHFVFASDDIVVHYNSRRGASL